MRMNDSTDVRSRRIEPSMDPQLAVRRADARANVAVRVDDEQMVFFGQSRRAAAWEQERIGAGYARADVTEHVRESAPFDNPIGERDIAPQCLVSLHDFVRLRNCAALHATSQMLR